MTEHLGELAALGTACCWTMTAMAFESAGRRVGSLSVNLIRLYLGFAFLAVYCWITRGLPLPTDATAESWFWLSLSGLVGFLVGDLCLFRAFVLIGARLSMLIMALVPPMTAITGRLWLGEELSPRDWTGMALTVAGVGWVVLERRRDNGEGRSGFLPVGGVALAFLGALGQAVGLVMSKVGMGDYSPFAATEIRIAVGITGFSLLFVFIGWWPRVFAALREGPAMARVSLGAFFGPFLGVSLSLMAVQHTDSGVAATIMSIVPVLIIPPAIIIFKEKVSSRAALGAVMAVVGVAILFL